MSRRSIHRFRRSRSPRRSPRCGGKNRKKTPAPVVTVDVAPVLLSKIQRTIRADGAALSEAAGGHRPEDHRACRQDATCSAARASAPASCSSSSRTRISRAPLAKAARPTIRPKRPTRPRRRPPCRRKLQKAELDARAAKDALNAAQSVYDNRQRALPRGRDRRRKTSTTRRSR